jgi:signal transduction histidine kinase
MNPLRPQLRGLMSRLTLFYLLLSLPCLILVESAILIFEYESFISNVESGSLVHATERASVELAGAWPSAKGDEPSALGYWAQAWILRLQRPRGGLIEGESYLLLELAEVPLAAAVLGPDGRLIAQAPAQADWRPDLPSIDSTEFANARDRDIAVVLPGSDDPYTIRRVLAPVHQRDGTRGYLFVELRLPVPWHRFLLDLSLEWPIVLGYLLVFGIASSIFLATWVTRRLNRVARAATAWSRGDFSDRIDDRSRDELGRLSWLLDGMALELKALMRSRAQLATVAERQRLARDLHDTVKQQAFALNLQLAALRRQLVADPAIAERIGQAERLSQQMQQELAQILDELRASDTALPFTERLRARALEWAQVSGVALGLELSDVPGIAAADQETLLRITDEALANVLRHSGATSVGLAISRQGDTLALDITDNGRGASDQAQPGMGLANMRERAESLPQGRFILDSRIGQGTRISIRFAIVEPDKTTA